MVEILVTAVKNLVAFVRQPFKTGKNKMEKDTLGHKSVSLPSNFKRVTDYQISINAAYKAIKCLQTIGWIFWAVVLLLSLPMLGWIIQMNRANIAAVPHYMTIMLTLVAVFIPYAFYVSWKYQRCLYTFSMCMILTIIGILIYMNIVLLLVYRIKTR